MTPKGLRNLAFRIASGVVANALRSYKTATRKRMPLDSDQAASRTNPAVEPIDPALRKQLEAALRTLPADDRQLLAMRLRGAAWSEVARSMGITAPAARKRWERLRAWFVLTLDGYEP